MIMLRNYKEFVNESYEITEDDYNYFRGLIEESELNRDISEIVNDIIDNRMEWIDLMMMTAKHHWKLGDGQLKDFPSNQYFKVINDVLDEYIRK